VSDIDKMQADAVSRAKEMYSRRSPSYEAEGFPKGYNGTMKTNGNPHSDKTVNSGESKDNQDRKSADESVSSREISSNAEHEMEGSNAKYSEKSFSQSERSNDILSTILADKEKALIILLIALLNEENASPSLMLALMYLII